MTATRKHKSLIASRTVNETLAGAPSAITMAQDTVTGGGTHHSRQEVKKTVVGPQASHVPAPSHFSQGHPVGYVPPFQPPASTYMPHQYYPPQFNPHAAPMVPSQSREEQDSRPALQSAALLGVGGFVGLAAAAAFRWMNGGDFSLLPDPSQVESKAPDELKQAVDDLRMQLSRQEQTLARIEANAAREKNNKFMDILREEPSSQALLDDRLASLQSTLDAIHFEVRTKGPAQVEHRIKTAMDEVSHCLKEIRSTRLKSGLEVSSDSNFRSAFVPSVVASHSLETSMTADGDSESIKSGNPKTLEEALRLLTEDNNPDEIRQGVKVLYLYLHNLAQHPDTPRYRKIFTSNESFKKVDRLTGGRDVLLAVGFTDEGNCLVYDDSDSRSKGLLDSAVAALKLVRDSPSSQLREPRELATPPPAQYPVVGLADAAVSSILQTPEIGSVVSPPVTKKRIFPPETTEFTALHPLQRSLENNRSMEVPSPIEGEHIHTS